MSETKRRPGGHPGMRGPGVPGEKAKDFRGSLGKLIRHCKPFYPVICIAILGDLAGSAFFSVSLFHGSHGPWHQAGQNHHRYG